MKPLGTITMCFPFLKNETVMIIELLMQDSFNYANFLDRLVKEVLERESSPMTVLFLVTHLHDINRLRDLEPICEKYQNLTLMQPYIAELGLSKEKSSIDDVLQSASEIASATQNPWVLFQMHLLRFYCGSTQSIGSVVEQDALEKLQNLVDANSDMSCFRPIVDSLIASRLLEEGNLSEALNLSELRMKHHLSCDDLVGLRESYLSLAYQLRHLDTRKADELLDKYKELSTSLGFDVEKEWPYHNIRASIHNARGEYSLSLEIYDLAIRYRETQLMGIPLRYLPLNISYLYGELEDGENALEWSKMAMESSQFLSDAPNFNAMVYTRMARAFVLLGDIEQAEMFLKRGESETLRIGTDSAIVETYIVAGHIERAKGNLANAMYDFERGLEIAERIKYQNRINSCLIGLVKSEIAILEYTDSTKLLETSGPWMKLLESETEKKDLPGIYGILLLLKVELRIKQRRIDEAIDLLKEIRSISQQPGLLYLNGKADKLQNMCELLEKEDQGRQHTSS